MAPGTTATVMVNVSSNTAVGSRISQRSHGSDNNSFHPLSEVSLTWLITNAVQPHPRIIVTPLCPDHHN